MAAASNFIVKGHCIAKNICSGDTSTDQNGKQQNLDPNGNQDIQKQAQQIQTGELGPNAQTGQLPPNTQATGENPNAPTQSTGANTQTGQLGPNTQTGQLGPNAQTGQLGPNAQTGELGPNGQITPNDNLPGTTFNNSDLDKMLDNAAGGPTPTAPNDQALRNAGLSQSDVNNLTNAANDSDFKRWANEMSTGRILDIGLQAGQAFLLAPTFLNTFSGGSDFGVGSYSVDSGGGVDYNIGGNSGYSSSGNITGFGGGGSTAGNFGGSTGHVVGQPGSGVYQPPGAGTGPGLMQSAQELAQQQALQQSQAQNQSAVQSYLNSCGGFSSCVAQGLNSAADYTTAAVKNLYDSTVSAIYGPQPVQVASNDANAPIMNDAGSMLLGDTPAPDFNSPAAQQAIQSGVRSYTTAYAPGAGGSMEGGFTTSRPNLSGQYVPATLDDVRLGNSDYVTLAGAPENYGKYYDMGSVTYKSPIDGVTYTGDPTLADPSNPKGPVYDPHLADVTGYVNDTGSAFNAGTCGNYGTCGIRQNKFDVAVGNFSGWNDARASSFVANEPFTGTNSWDQVAGLPSSNFADSGGIPNGGSLTGTGSSLPSDVVAQAEGNLATQYGPTTAGLEDITQFANTPSVSELTNLPPNSFQTALHSAPNPTIPLGNEITSSFPVTFEVQGGGVSDLGTNAIPGDLGANASAIDYGAATPAGPPSGILQVQPVSPSSPIALNNIGAAALQSIPVTTPVSPLLGGIAPGPLGPNASPFDIGDTSRVSPYLESGSPMDNVALDQPGYQLPEVAVNESGSVSPVGGTLDQANPQIDTVRAGLDNTPNGAATVHAQPTLGSSDNTAPPQGGAITDASQGRGLISEVRSWWNNTASPYLIGTPAEAPAEPGVPIAMERNSYSGSNVTPSQGTLDQANPATDFGGAGSPGAQNGPTPPPRTNTQAPPIRQAPSAPPAGGPGPSRGPSSPAAGGPAPSGGGSGLAGLLQGLMGMLKAAGGGSGGGSSRLPPPTQPVTAPPSSVLQTPVSATQFPPAPPLTPAPQVTITAAPNPVAPDTASTVSWNSNWQPGNATSTRECAMIDAHGTVLSDHATTTGSLPTPALARAAYFIVGCKEKGGTLGSAVVLVSVKGSTAAPDPLPQPLRSYESVSGISTAGSDLESALGTTGTNQDQQQPAQDVACDPNSSSYFDCLTGKMQFVDKLY